MLTNTAIRSARPRDKAYKLFDGGGLYIEVIPTGGKLWRLKFRHDGRENRLALGAHPDTTLKLARERRDEARRLIAAGIDPASRRQAEKLATANTFEAVAREWLALQEKKLAPATYAKAVWTLETLVFPYVGSSPIAKLGPYDVLKVLKRIEGRGTHETAHRTRQRCAQVFRYAVQTERAERDPTADLRGAHAPVVSEHFATITEPVKIGELLRAIDGYTGHIVTACALKLAPLVFVRPGELRHAEWTEFDLDEEQWCLKLSKRDESKSRRGDVDDYLVVPLSHQAVEVLRGIHGLTGDGVYVFPSARDRTRPMSENGILAALRRYPG